MLTSFFNSQTKTITFAAILLGISALVSGLLGLFRDRLLAAYFGASSDLDIYFAAFRIPDFVYGILIMGGISAVFLPIFAEYFQRNKEEAWQFTSNLLNVFLILLIFFCGLLALFTPWLIQFIAPGFGPEEKSLAISLTRIMFLSPIFFGLSSVFSGVLHYFNRFLAYSLAPILYNLGIILGIVFFVPIFGLSGLAYGVVLGAFFHWVIQAPAAKSSGFKYWPVFDFKFPGLIKVFRLMIPRTIGAAAYHLNLIVITAIASTLSIGSIAIFNLADHLQHFPVALIGASFAIAAFPTLSRTWVSNFKGEFLGSFSSTFRQVLFLIIPVSVLILLLRVPIVRFVLGAGEFDELAVQLTAASLGLFCLGMFAFSAIPFLARVFYSFQNTKTPTLIGIGSMILNVVLAVFLVWSLRFPNFFSGFMIAALRLENIEDITVIGLPLALSLAGIFQFSLLLFFLKKERGEIGLREIRQSFWKIVLASFFMVVAVYLVLQAVSGVLAQIIFAGTTGVVSYFLLTLLFKSPELKTIKESIFRR
jgi:putative peptidoglycan lipid II flippase